MDRFRHSFIRYYTLFIFVFLLMIGKSRFFILLLLCLCHSGIAQGLQDRGKVSDGVFGLDTFSLAYNSGGCFPATGQLIFYRDHLQWMAVNKDHWYHYGKHTDTSWVTVLNRQKLEWVKESFDTANTKGGLFGFENPDEGTACYYILEADSLSRGWPCNPGISRHFSFDSIERVLFREFFEELEKKRTRIRDSVLADLMGKWELQIPKAGSIKYGDTLHLIKLAPGKQSDRITWSFLAEGVFKSTGLKHSHLIYSLSYEVNTNGPERIIIASGYKTSERKDKDFVHLGADLQVLYLDDNRMRVIYSL